MDNNEVPQSFNGDTYKLQLPSSIKVHDTFHLSLLKRFHPDKHLRRKTNLREEAEEPEAILKQQVRNGNTKFLIKWKGRPLSEATWISEESLFPSDPTFLFGYPSYN